MPDKKVLLLQPRRVAARASARRIAFEHGTPLGTHVGYRIRFEKKTGPDTRIEVLTEGLLTRLLQSDPFLEGVGAVVLDEFHERSIHSDLAIALLKEVQADARPDLKIVVMSATLDAAPVQDFLGGPDACPLLDAEGRVFDVEIEHLARKDERPLEVQVGAAVRRAVKADPSGHVLVFLPGVGEIERAARCLSGLEGPEVLQLHGRLSSAEQDRALTPSSRQKVVLATNLAETSLTIEGVTTVIDSGLVRRPRFDGRLGTDRLETLPNSRASATQRAGRAGRTRPGRCIRLWTEHAERLRADFDPPAIQTSDLAPTLLQLYAWGSSPGAFGWFEAPGEGGLRAAEGLLERLGAVADGRITPLGQQLVRLPIHPRVAAVLVRGAALGCLDEAAEAALVASERDPRVRGQLVNIGRRLRVPRAAFDGDLDQRVLDALIAGFPDRVGQRRDSSGRRLLLSSGQGAELAHGVQADQTFVAVVLTAGPKGRPPLVRVVEDIAPERLPAEWVEELRFDRERLAVSARRVLRFGALVLDEKPPSERDVGAISALLAAEAADSFETLFPFTGDAGRLLRRLQFLVRVRPDLDAPGWVEQPQQLLGAWCVGKRSFEQLRRFDVLADLKGRLPWALRGALADVAPERMRVPGGASIRLDYPSGGPPVLAARIQQLFGMKRTPRLGGEPITIHLLAPNGRPAQITQDLESFWANTYAEVRKDLRGRYPKHAWPEDPSTREA